MKCFKELNLFYILLFKYKNILFLLFLFYFHDINEATKTLLIIPRDLCDPMIKANLNVLL